METSELTYRGRSEREIFPEQEIHAKRGYADTTMSAASKLLNPTRFTLYRLQGSRIAHLDNCTAKKMIQKKASCKDYGSSFKIAVWSQDHDEKIKLQRAQGGCPGTIRRRRTWQAAKSYGEPQAGIDP